MARKNLDGTSLDTLEDALLKGCDATTDFTWYVVTEGISRLIIGSYDLGLDPLPQLREIFPNFTWEMYKIDAQSPEWFSQLLALVAESDYFFAADEDTEEFFVIARRKNFVEPAWRILANEEMLGSCTKPNYLGAERKHPLYDDE